MTQHKNTSTRKVTIRFHLFDQKKRLFQNKNKAARSTVRNRERAFTKFRTIDPFGIPSLNFSQIWQHCCCCRANKRCLNLIASNVNKNKATRCYPFPRQPHTNIHTLTDKHTHTDTRKEIVKPGSSNFYKLHIFYK